MVRNSCPSQSFTSVLLNSRAYISVMIKAVAIRFPLFISNFVYPPGAQFAYGERNIFRKVKIGTETSVFNLDIYNIIHHCNGFAC